MLINDTPSHDHHLGRKGAAHNISAVRLGMIAVLREGALLKTVASRASRAPPSFPSPTLPPSRTSWRQDGLRQMLVITSVSSVPGSLACCARCVGGFEGGGVSEE